MPSGIDQPGGAGTRIFVYDDSSPWLDAAMTFPRTPGPYSELDLINAVGVGIVNAADFEQLVGFTTTLGFTGRQQFLSHVPVRIGGADTDGSAPTSLQLVNVDLFFDNTTALEYRTASYSPSLLTTRLGTRQATEFGSFRDIIGADGCMIFATNALIFRGNMAIYGSLIGGTQGALQFLDTGGSLSEVCGNLLFPGSGLTLGNAGAQMIAQNNMIVTKLGNIPLANISVLDANGTAAAGSGSHNSFLASSTANLRLNGLRFIGTPGSRDITWNSAAASNWNLIGLGWSQALNKPKMGSGANIPLSSSAKEWRYFNTKVCDTAGKPLADIPVRLESDIDGGVVNTKTFGDGDIGFSSSGLTPAVSNMVKVRDHYNPTGSGSYTVRDRVFTLSVNGTGGAFAQNTSYPHVIIRFEWPGKDILRGTYVLNGGIFTDCIVPITLGTIGASYPAWRECDTP